MTLIS